VVLSTYLLACVVRHASANRYKMFPQRSVVVFLQPDLAPSAWLETCRPNFAGRKPGGRPFNRTFYSTLPCPSLWRYRAVGQARGKYSVFPSLIISALQVVPG
jgi:hypothetical protein